MGTLNSDKTWIIYGKKNPYYGVITDERFLDKNISEESLKEFFFSGVIYVDDLFETIHNHIDRSFKPNTVLDFGCGTGRLVIPFAMRYEKVVGLDISRDILEIARLNAAKRDLKNIEFYISDDNLTEISDQKFDLINSFIVLQHINLKRGEKLIQNLLKRLNPNGICALHMTYFTNKPLSAKIVNFFRIRIPFLHNLLNVLERKPLKSPLIQMNSYNLNNIFYLLQSDGIENCHVMRIKS
jgi:SAM-dependent methyltransferase